MSYWQAGAAILGALLSAKSSRDQTKAMNAAAEKQNQLDPRIAEILFGKDNSGGWLNELQQFKSTPMSDPMRRLGVGASDYVSNYSGADTERMRNASYSLLDGRSSPEAFAATSTAAQGNAAQAGPSPTVGAFGQDILWNKGETFNAPDAMQAAQIGPVSQVQAPQGLMAAVMSGAQVNAPSQNNLDLSRSYDSFINGQAGNNPYLTGAIGKGINQARNAFDDVQSDMTRNMLENVLPSIRSNAILSGGLGGSRQGIAEGRALAEMVREGNRAATRFGQGATDAAVSAQAGAYDADRNRALSATQGLGAQQYGVAQQNASMQQQANIANQAAQNQAGQTNYSGLMQAALANAGAANQAASQNAGLQQQANSTNYAGQLQTNQQNAANLQQANLANQVAGNNASQANALQNQAASMANANLGQQNNQFNAGLQQQTNMANLGNNQQMALANLGNLQGTNLANLQARLTTNAQNNGAAATGLASMSGLLDSAIGRTQGFDNYTFDQFARTNNLLMPYLSQVPRQNAPQYFSNTGGSALGGAMMGLQFANMMRNMSPGGTSSFGGSYGSLGDLFSTPSSSSPIW